MIDLRRLADDADYRAGALRKGADEAHVFNLIELAEAARTQRTETESLRAEANQANKEIGRAAPEDREAKIEGAKALRDRLGSAEQELTQLDNQVNELALVVPNPAHESVPDGGEDGFRIEKVHGAESDPPPLSHAEIGERLGLVDTDRAVRMSGSRFAYILGDAVRLQFALMQWTMNKLIGRDFTPVIVPVLVREDMLVEAGFFPTDRNQVYELERDELFLVGTSEVGLAGLHRGERLDADDLPVRYAGYSSCFRREAGTYGKDTQGLFRVHQFDKVEMFSYAHPDRSWDELETLRAIEEEIFTELELPYRVITVAAGDLGAAAAKKYDIEVWLGSEQRYREVTSCSNYTDFSARRMSTRTKTSSGSEFVHTLNGTACAIGRTLLAIFENHQNDDGSITVPSVLRPLCGLDVIEPKEKASSDLD
ncbi:MAG: serine--tRNA ligase [Acidimicrobiales bacterium]|nr:serine--tRNA ligase [Acidimicrobiales bacterium]